MTIGFGRLEIIVVYDNNILWHEMALKKDQEGLKKDQEKC